MKSIREIWLIFLRQQENHPKGRMVFMKIIKEELQFEENLKQRLEFICEFAKVTPTFMNGSIRKLDKTNLSYIEPHRVIIKNNTFLVFNYSNDVYISNLTKKIKLSELEEYLKTIMYQGFDISKNRDIILLGKLLCLLGDVVYDFKQIVFNNRYIKCKEVSIVVWSAIVPLLFIFI